MIMIGVDVGTSGAKALAFAEDWQVVGSGRASYAVQHMADGRAELDVEAVMAAVQQACRDCAASAPGPIHAAAFTVLGEAIFPVDSTGQPLAAAPTNADNRAQGLAQRWQQQYSAEDIREVTGLPPRDMWAANRIWLWQQENLGAAMYHTFEDGILRRLGLPPTMAVSLAARTQLYDQTQQAWHDDFMSTVGINAQQLAAVHLPGQPVGTISHGAGEAFGLPNGTVIAGGGHDQFCNALGSGATSHQPMWSTGTVDSVTFLVDRPPADLHPSVPCYPVDHDRYSVPFANLNGGAALAWLARLFGKDPAALLADAVYDPGRLWVLPLFGVTGAPDYDTDASGTLHGLRYSDTRASIAAALVEGVVLETRYALEANGAPLKQIQAVNLAGGGAQSRYWADLKASALHCPAYIRRHFDAGCVGAAMLAWEALTGQRPDIEQTNAVVDVVEPSASEMIATRFERYRYLREAFRPLSSS